MSNQGLVNVLVAGRLAIKQHAFEFGAASLIALLVGVAALAVALHFMSVGMPTACLEGWLSGASAGGGCESFLQAFGRINEDEASPIFAAMAVLPFAAGLVAGVPIVGRELETRTAQTAWWLESSRRKWLGRQLMAPAAMVLISVGVAATATALLQATRESWAPTSADTVLLFGWPVLFRAFAAFGIGLFVGSLMGRILPALIVGTALCLAVAFAMSSVQAQWMRGQAKAVVDDPGWHGHSYGVAYVDPDGQVHSEAEAVGIAPAAAPNAYDWLEANGYTEVPLGVSDQAAAGWRTYDVAMFAAIGIFSVLGTIVVVSRRRPQ